MRVKSARLKLKGHRPISWAAHCARASAFCTCAHKNLSFPERYRYATDRALPHVRFGYSRDGVEPAADAAMFVIPPKAEVNSEH
jgi:hypothetical protein